MDANRKCALYTGCTIIISGLCDSRDSPDWPFEAGITLMIDSHHARYVVFLLAFHIPLHRVPSERGWSHSDRRRARVLNNRHRLIITRRALSQLAIPRITFTEWLLLCLQCECNFLDSSSQFARVKRVTYLSSSGEIHSRLRKYFQSTCALLFNLRDT